MQVVHLLPPEATLIPEEEPLAIRKEDWPSINQAIANAIDPLRPSGWRKALLVLREWGVLGTIATVIVALLGIAAAAIYQATARVAKEATFETNTTRDLGEIRKDVKTIQEDLAKQNLVTHASLSLSDFKAALPEVGSAITKAKQQEVKVPPNVVDTLQQQIIAAGDATPGYWSTSAEFISYRSFDNVVHPARTGQRS